jgi:hypothetical protein
MLRTHASFLRASFVSVVCLLPAIPAGAAQCSDHQEVVQLRQLVADLQSRVAALEQHNAGPHTWANETVESGADTAAALVRATATLRGSEPAAAAPASPQNQALPAAQPEAAAAPATLPGGISINYLLDLYYEYNFNQPIGRANDLRAYDVLSNSFSINQADMVVDLDPDLTVNRRYGARLDLQFGQATETLQGNPANEPRPEIYRNIFQAYGTYIVPAGRGLSVDVGKWASSLGVEGNYTKDQMNYTRSFFFYFLPFYHAGIRTHYPLNDKLTVNYWLVNGTNQSEPTNGYKDELFGYTLQPDKAVSWTFNYYLGQDHPDVTTASNCTVPVQPGLCLAPITPAPNGKLHIFDSYANWQLTDKLALVGEADYYIQREWANAAPGESSAPAHVTGGAAYAQYALTPHTDFALRGEYFSDRGGLFSGVTQALKEGTATYEYKFNNNLLSFLEFRRDWSNRNYFTTANTGVLSNQQPTIAAGLVWWYGAKQGAW